MEELDIWIFLKTGEWIWQHQQIPTRDFFSYTFQGQTWTHIKWVYSVLVYGLQELGKGPEFMMVFQAICNFLIAYLIIIIARTRFHQMTLNVWSFLFFVILWIFCEYRMNGRPENISHIFILFYAFVFQKQELKPYWLWFLIPAQILWSNLHDAYTLGLLISGIFVTTQFLKTKNKSLLFWFLILLCSSCLNPLGITSLNYTWSVFSQLQTNQYTPELFSAFYPEYWEHISPYAMLLGIIIFLFQIKNSSFVTCLKSWYFNIGILLFFIGLSNYRNIVFFLFWVSPYILHLFPQAKRLNLALLIIIPLFYNSIVSGFYYQNIKSRHGFGLYYSEQKQPVLASSFIKHQDLSKDLCAEGTILADYLSSSYLLWDLYPRFKTFIDLRDLDVFTPKAFENYHTIMQNPQSLDDIFEKYHITEVTLYLKTEAKIHQYLYHHPEWQLIYIDHNMVIYQRICYVKNNELAFKNQSSTHQYKRCSSISHIINQTLNWKWTKEIDSQINNMYIRAKYLQLVRDDRSLLNYILQHQSQNIFDLQYQILLYKTLSKYPNYRSQSEQVARHIQSLQNTNL